MKMILIVIKQLLLILPVISLLFAACKKDSDNSIIPVPALERVSSIHGLKGGLDDYKEEYHYSGGQLSDYYIYRHGKEGEWLNWLRYRYEYPSENQIIETREGYADSIWFLANKNEKTYHGGQLEEIIQYEFDMGSPGNWRPVKKISWEFTGDLPKERISWIYNNGWEESKRSEYEYTGSLWTGLLSYANNNGSWDSIGCMALIYNGGHLTEVNVYECHQLQGWSQNEQYLLHYQGSSLTDMKIYCCSGDSLSWESTISVGYNSNGLVDKYIIDYDCCPTEELLITYDEGWGNYRQATAGCSSYLHWPWFPAALKK